ncbi:MAG TPA: hypothetical protein VGS07_09500 [Thermoanaerobaculia bacterium]|jgi:hypothetical protein|nr:hypothetical protein [Thermoanaerobaculia bacterium]
MARGWESKSVESQQDAQSPSEQGDGMTPEQRRRKLKRESVEMSRRRVLQEIETTRSEVRRASLEQALAFLDQQLAELSDSKAS